MNTKDIRIAAEPQMDPNICRFVVDRPVYDGFFNCRNQAMASGSPLLEALFKLPGVTEVLVAGASITVAKNSSEEWADLGRKVGETIRDRIAAGGTLVAPGAAAKQPPIPGLREKVQKIFDEEINPGISGHGGSVELKDIQGSVVFVTLAGGCQGCASASFTLRYGIEQLLRERVPEVTDVVDVTDHGAGEHPYF
jgi:NFU1 iron-sulfur cluster scaffold homolog, mitochondrial